MGGGGECCLGDEAVAHGGAASSSSRSGHSFTAADASTRELSADFHTDATASPSVSPLPPPPPVPAPAAAPGDRTPAWASAASPSPPFVADPGPAADVASASALVPHACVGADDRGSSEWEVVARPEPSAPPLASEFGSGTDSAAPAAAAAAAAAGVSELGAVSVAAMDAGSLLDNSAGQEQQQKQQHQQQRQEKHQEEEEQGGEDGDVDDKDNREQGRAAEKRMCEEEEAKAGAGGSGAAGVAAGGQGGGAAAAAHAPERAAAALPRSLSSVYGSWWREVLAAAVSDCSCYPAGPAAAHAASAAAPAIEAAGWGGWGAAGAEEGLLAPVLVVGPAGSGKSTLVNAILRAVSTAAAGGGGSGSGCGGCFSARPVEVPHAGLARSGSMAGVHGGVQAERVAPVPCRTRGLGVAFTHVYPAAAAAAAASFEHGSSGRSSCQQQSQRLRQIVLLDTPGVLEFQPPLAGAGAPMLAGPDCVASSAPLLQPRVDSAVLQWQAAEASRLLSLWLHEGLREGDSVSLAPPSQLVHTLPQVPQGSIGTGAAADGTTSSSSSYIAGGSGAAGRPLLKPVAAVLVVSAVDLLALAVGAEKREGKSSRAMQQDVQHLQARALKAYFDLLLLHYADVCPPVVLTRMNTLSDEQCRLVRDYLTSAWGVVPQLDLFEMPPPGTSGEEEAKEAVVVLNESLKRGIGPSVYAVSFPVPGPAPAHHTIWRDPAAAAAAGRAAATHHHSPVHLAEDVWQWLLDVAHELHPQLAAILNDPAWQRAIRRSLMAAIAMTLVAIVLVAVALWSILSMLEPFSPFHPHQQQQHHRQNYYYRTKWGGGVGGNGSWPFW